MGGPRSPKEPALVTVSGPGTRAWALCPRVGSGSVRGALRRQAAHPRQSVSLAVLWGVASPGQAGGQCSTWSRSYFSQKRLVKGKQVRYSIQGQWMG